MNVSKLLWTQALHSITPLSCLSPTSLLPVWMLMQTKFWAWLVPQSEPSTWLWAAMMGAESSVCFLFSSQCSYCWQNRLVFLFNYIDEVSEAQKNKVAFQDSLVNTWQSRIWTWRWVMSPRSDPRSDPKLDPKLDPRLISEFKFRFLYVYGCTWIYKFMHMHVCPKCLCMHVYSDKGQRTAWGIIHRSEAEKPVCLASWQPHSPTVSISPELRI